MTEATPVIRNMNDGTERAPYLRIDLCMGNLDGLMPESKGPAPDAPDVFERLKAAGYEGIQGSVEQCVAAQKAGLRATGIAGGVHKVGDAAKRAALGKENGLDAFIFHVGTGFEDDDTTDALVQDVIKTSIEIDLPLYIEIHRATITTDIYRTVKMVERNPGVRFNGDFSHFYTGHEMVYGDFEGKLDFMQPVFDRVRFMHGRLGNSSHMQVALRDGIDQPFIGHFREMWARAFRGFLASAAPGDYIVFAPEILWAVNNYAFAMPGPDGQMREESDRWEQAFRLCDLAREAFEIAQKG